MAPPLARIYSAYPLGIPAGSFCGGSADSPGRLMARSQAAASAGEWILRRDRKPHLYGAVSSKELSLVSAIV